jgi:uncharacterized glyoxalase superfamily protein PhnB
MPTFDAIGVIATDLGATLDFYRLLGLRVPERAESESHVEIPLGQGMRLMIDPIETVERFSTYEPATGGRNVGFAFRCGSPAEVDATFESVTTAGYAAKAAPFDAFWGQRYATVLDPDGNPVDLYASSE